MVTLDPSPAPVVKSSRATLLPVNIMERSVQSPTRATTERTACAYAGFYAEIASIEDSCNNERSCYKTAANASMLEVVLTPPSLDSPVTTLRAAS